MNVDVLIVGQGICGTLLSWFLYKQNKSFIVIDHAAENSSSKVAAGIINPITGRRYVYTWMIEEVMPFALETYQNLGAHFNKQYIIPKSIIDFFPSAQMLDAFATRLTENDTFLHSFPDQNRFNQFFNYDFGCGEIRPAYIVNFPLLMAEWRKHLINTQCLKAEEFILNDLVVDKEQVRYRDITAQKIIMCDGIASLQNPWFQNLPFAPNKGEALIIECKELTREHIFKKGTMLVPLPEQHHYWVGSNYQWEFENDQPSERFYQQTVAHLKAWLKFPFEVLSHKAAIRPATLERRPFVGFHPQFPSIGILNGMGTKGSSLAPYFAHQLVQHLTGLSTIAAEADVQRFSRLLSK